MLFKDLAVGQKFKVNDEVYTKVDEVGRTCCRAGHNAVKDNIAAYIEHETEVELVNE